MVQVKYLRYFFLRGVNENLFSHTIAALEKFDNQHEFERMAADILNSLGYENVMLMAPRGGSDRGMDITFTTDDRRKGLACVTLRKGIDVKFKEDFSKRKVGEFNLYILFCTAYLTASQKLQFTQYCLNTLQAEFLPKDIETLRSLLDSTMLPIRKKYLDASFITLNHTASIEEQISLETVYIPINIALTKFTNQYEEIININNLRRNFRYDVFGRVSFDMEETKNKFLQACEEFIKQISELYGQGKDIYLTSKIDENLRSFIKFLKGFDPGGRIWTRGEFRLIGREPEITQSSEFTLIDRELELSAGTLGSFGELITSRKFEKSFMHHIQLLKALIKEVTHNSLPPNLG